MDGVAVIEIAGAMAALSFPTYYYLSRVNEKLGKHEGKLEALGEDVKRMDQKLETMNTALLLQHCDKNSDPKNRRLKK